MLHNYGPHVVKLFHKALFPTSQRAEVFCFTCFYEIGVTVAFFVLVKGRGW